MAAGINGLPPETIIASEQVSGKAGQAPWMAMVSSAAGDSQLLDLYKLAVEMADRTSARRAAANAFFLSAQTALVAVLGVASPNLANAPWWAVLALVLAGLVVSTCWWLQLRSYRSLSRAKFAVITAMEQRLPMSIFADEWSALRRDRAAGWRGRYAELRTIERAVPWSSARSKS